jgi:NADH-quinone oxidoreductase subunit L
MAGVFVTAFYTFRMMFMTFHGAPRFDTAPAAHGAAHDAAHGQDDHAHVDHHGGPPKESPWVVTVPLVLLAIPSIVAGWIGIEPMLFGDFFGNSIVVLERHPAMAQMKEEWHGVWAFLTHGLTSLPLELAAAGIGVAWLLYLWKPALPGRIAKLCGPVYTLLDNKYYFDRFNDWFFADGARKVGGLFSNVGDRMLIEGVVNGSAHLVSRCAALLRRIQSGFVYHYAFTMIIGLFALLIWWVPR